MSIAKPALKNPWASSGSANIANPGGANETGIPSLAKSIPRRWLNWILNEIDTAARYLVSRGIPDYDALESYSVGDRVQWGAGWNRVYVCVATSVGDGTGTNSPGTSPDTWACSDGGIPTYRSDGNYKIGDFVLAPSDGDTYQCILANYLTSPKEPHASPTYWERWGHTDDEVRDLARLYETNSISTGSTDGFTLSTGSVSNVIDARIGYATMLRDLSFALSNIPATPGYIDVTLGSPITFGSAIKNIQVTSAYATANAPYGEITGNNSVRVHAVRDGGPMTTAFVRLLGY